tara:strand:- start:211 stop:693 length:483 start_codon:yes stop_codon:yes gene_type:complete
MDPNKWGPHLWFFLHTISFNYPVTPTFKNKVDYNDFYNSLKNMIPCELCKTHYMQHLEVSPPDLSSRNALVKWTIDLHNKVNTQLNKPVYSYSKAITLYKKYYKGLNENNGLNAHDYSTHIEDSNMNFVKYLQISVLTVVLVLLLVYLFKKRNIKKIRFL